MKNLFYFFLLIRLLFQDEIWAQSTIAQFDFPATNSLVVSSKHANLAVTDISLSSGTIETNISTGEYFPNEPYIEETGGWTANTQSDAKNFYFTITANSGYSFSITNISFNAYATSAGPTAFSSEIDGTSLDAVNAPSAALVSYNKSVSGKTGLTSAVIKIQGWLNGSRSSSGSGTFRLDDIIITGTVTGVPEINLKVGSTGIASGGTYDFGNRASGSSGTAVTFTIENIGVENLNLTGLPNKISISGTNSSEFAVNESATTTPVAASSSTSFTIAFNPTSKGSKTAAIAIANDDADEGNYTINLTGTGNLGTNVVIAEIYGGGGNSGASYKNDYVVLYNPTSSAVDFSGWSLQYQTAGGTGNYNDRLNLSGSINSNEYFLIKLYSAGSNGADLPVPPNLTGTINLSATAGKVALVNNQDAIDTVSDVNVVDFVGYGPSANEYEGTSYATSPSNTASIRRKDNAGNETYGSNGSGYDSNQNVSDFYKETDILTNSPLPVEFVSFYAESRQGKIILNWSTATEINNLGFGIERKIEFGKWQSIGFVKGHGNSYSPKFYSFTDETPPAGIIYYRLNQIDFDGQSDYSETVSIEFNAGSIAELSQNYPNPFNPFTVIKFSLPAKDFVKLAVYNLLGEEIEILFRGELIAGSYKFIFNGSQLPSGIYYYSLAGKNYFKSKAMVLLK